MAAKKSIGYDKVLLGLGALVAIGLITMVGLKAGGVKDDFEVSSGKPKGPPRIKGEGAVTWALATLEKAPTLGRGKTADGRSVDLLTGIPWYIKKDGGEAVDLLDPKGEQIHEGMDNIWWHENNLDVGWSDSPERDPDIDGFSNREEYAAKTDPNDPSKFPSVVTKVELVKLEKKPYKVTFSSEAGTTFQFRYLDTHTGRKREERTAYIPAGDDAASIFFPEGPAALRFRLLAVEERDVVNERTNVSSKQKFAKIEDLLPAKAGDVFEVPKGSREGLIRHDYAVVLMLNAAGAQGQEFKVGERETFSLPFNPDAAEKPYVFKEVLDDKTVIIAHDEGGETTLYRIDEGSKIEPYAP